MEGLLLVLDLQAVAVAAVAAAQMSHQMAAIASSKSNGANAMQAG